MLPFLWWIKIFKIFVIKCIFNKPLYVSVAAVVDFQLCQTLGRLYGIVTYFLEILLLSACTVQTLLAGSIVRYWMNCCAGISKYLRHSEAVSATHYDFSQIEQSARNRAAIVDLVGGKEQFCITIISWTQFISLGSFQLSVCGLQLSTAQRL